MTDPRELIERLRTTKLLSQRNQMALQNEAATALEASLAREEKAKVVASRAIRLAFIAGEENARYQMGKTTRKLLDTSPPPSGCHCSTKCMAPVVMGRQQPCRDPERFAALSEEQQT